MSAAASKVEARAAYDDMLDAIGHNHSGTLYAGAGPAAVALADFARAAAGWPRWAAIEVLTECVLWSSGDQPNREEAAAIRAAAASLHDLDTSDDGDVPTRRALGELTSALSRPTT